MDALVALGITNYALWIVRNTRSALFTKNGCTVCKSAMKVLKRLGECLVIYDASTFWNQGSKSISQFNHSFQIQLMDVRYISSKNFCFRKDNWHCRQRCNSH